MALMLIFLILVETVSNTAFVDDEDANLILNIPRNSSVPPNVWIVGM